MTEGMHRDRRARKGYQCDGVSNLQCLRWIEPGTYYQVTVLPPGSEMGNTGWWRNRLCASCAAYYGHPILLEVSYAG